MLRIDKVAGNRVDIALDGQLDADAMRDGIDELLKASEGVTGGRMLYTINEFSLPTLGAIAVEFGRMPQLFGLLKHYDRCAVLCDTGWVRTAAEVEGALFPGLEIKAFEMKDRAQAEAWLGESAG